MPKQELYDEKGQLAREIQELAKLGDEEGRTWTAEDQEKWEKLNGSYDALSKRLEREERKEELAAEHAKKVLAEERRQFQEKASETPEAKISRELRSLSRDEYGHLHAHALQAWCRSGEGMTDEHRRGCRLFGLNPQQKEISIKLRVGGVPYDAIRRYFQPGLWEHRMTLTATEGGELVPEGFIAELERALLAFGGVRQVARVLRTASGNDLPWPTVDDTSNSGALIAEATEDAVLDVATSEVVFQAFKYTSKIVKVSAELLSDSAINLAAELGSILGERIARAVEAHLTTGTGSSQPKGIVTCSGEGVEAAATTAFTAEEIMDLYHSVDVAYRRSGRLFFMMHDNVVLAVRKMRERTDTTPDGGNFLWQPGLQAGQPDRLLGVPIVVNNSMASSIAASAKVMVFGDGAKYIIRDVAEIRMRRLQERYAEYDQEAFIGYSRHDGDSIQTAALKHMIMAAS